MEPFKAYKLPIEYETDKELLKLLAEANQKYGEYKSFLKNLDFDSKFFLDSIILSESLKSSQIEGTQISQDQIYYLKYMPTNDESKEIQNLKDCINYAEKYLKDYNEINLSLINSMHEILLDSVRGNEKNPGKLRQIQNWIGPKGGKKEEAIFVPPIYEEVPILLNNLFKYMNDAYIDPIFINLAISHSQFQTIHPYHDGNGRVGRALIPIQLSLLDDHEPILYLSEIIELYKPSYYKFLNESRKGNMLGFIKFFLQCIIEQCNNYIYKINKIKIIYNQDYGKIKEIKGGSIHIVMPIIMRQIVFTVNEVVQESGLSRNTINRLLSKLIDLDIIVPDNKYAKKAYRYQEIYNVFVTNE